MDHAKLQQERLTSTKLEPYDMITAVTERSINAQLQAMHSNNESLRRILLTSPDTDDDWTGLNAELSAPTVQLKIGTEDRIVLFFVNIKSATLKYREIKGKKVEEKTCDFSDSRIAVSVNLTFETAAFTTLPPDVQKRLAVLNNYSINQLLIDFGSTSLARLDTKNSNVYEKLETIHLRAAAEFNIFMNMYFNALAGDHNVSVLHYIPLASAETDRQKYPMPTIPPTKLTFQNIPFLTSASDKGSLNDNNMLVYLQMTDKDATLPERLLEISANWVVPPPSDKEAERYDGTVALSRKIFLDGWLLPKLAEFNRDSTWIVKEAWSEDTGFLNLGTVIHMDGHMGWTGATESDIKWNAITADTVDQWAKDKVPGFAGDWYKFYNSNNKDDNGVIERVYQKGTTLNYCFIPESYASNGKCEILVAGVTQVEFYVNVDLIPSKAKVTGTWSTKLVLDGVNDGELVITAENITPKIDKEVNDAIFHGGDIDNLINAAESGLKNLNMTSLLSKITKVFRDGWDFILPGAADFYISKAVFNKRKDLLCELKYRELA
ncbi:hypothetical protein D9619_010766 [Psilocybe cf. subviscida]|uniref:Uncharacterized protein n=1 Tax=Psilocybe cf. subviscida TaxID=2480587 RepID=A0A8H5B8Y8_9AGAR|nr:hypothetical protein D9619_010766 [Psilocybe cf. subviscida]